MYVIGPDIHNQQRALNSHEIVEDQRNGFAYWQFSPDKPEAIHEGLQGIAEYSGFKDTAGILQQAEQFGSVLIEGAPGAGKSHLVRELQEGAFINNVPAFCLTMHINQGKPEGIQNIHAPFEAFRTVAAETGGLVILDNVDMVGYKGKSKRGPAVAKYAADTAAFVRDIAADPSLITIATGHDELWREGRWVWNRPDVDIPANEVLDSFGARAVFEGKMTLAGLAGVLHEKGHRFDVAAKGVRKMREQGVADFFHANHLDLDAYMADSTAAVTVIEEKRAAMRTR